MDYASIIFRIVGDEKQNYARIMGEQFFKKNIIGKSSLRNNLIYNYYSLHSFNALININTCSMRECACNITHM